ncbi:MAG: hypothetical protein A3E01_10630 [Gammaproteobacteria bacterium RIFCSPHIGHO2_12_FULL_63_22]|nr:MAG: hypothetical protein A3E01_10630 [Gammaproteobacteria bacterium RIFCSPHIGHO2_12_FULL_63_22]
MSTPLPAIGFNPRPRIEMLRFNAQSSCLVVDDALLDPDALRRYATARRGDFVQAPFNAYPGIELPMPLEFSARLQDFFDRHIRGSLGGRRTVKMNSRLAMVTTPSDALEPRQRICHRDSAWIDPAQAIAASVLYLFEDECLGGTSFYRPRLPEDAINRLVHDSSVMDRASFDARHPSIAQGYMGESNDYFERIGRVPARWNRMIFYDGRLFHSGEVGNARALTGDPRAGRLTLNGFFTCSRPAG